MACPCARPASASRAGASPSHGPSTKPCRPTREWTELQVLKETSARIVAYCGGGFIIGTPASRFDKQRETEGVGARV